jgi:hypothetical protein
MTIRAHEAVVAEFLRKALADEALGVSKLEAMARAAGLLGERQRITHARLFRRAKMSLGIRSIRDGFGAGGGWSWELPRISEAKALSPSPIGPPPHDIPRHRWRQFVEDCHAFIASEGLANRAAQLGWGAMALFGCRANYPLMYPGNAGLLWQVNGGKVIELHRDWAVIDRPVNRSQRIFYRRDVDQEKVALPWNLRSKNSVRR